MQTTINDETTTARRQRKGAKIRVDWKTQNRPRVTLITDVQKKKIIKKIREIRIREYTCTSAITIMTNATRTRTYFFFLEPNNTFYVLTIAHSVPARLRTVNNYENSVPISWRPINVISVNYDTEFSDLLTAPSSAYLAIFLRDKCIKLSRRVV